MGMIQLSQIDQVLSNLQILAEQNGLGQLATKLTDARQSVNREICLQQVLERDNLRQSAAVDMEQSSNGDLNPNV